MSIQTRIGMPLDEFIRRGDEAPFELIDGEIVPKMPNVFEHSLLIKRIFLAFLPFEAQGLGEVFSETTYALMEGPDWVKGSRIPDVMWLSADKVTQFLHSIPNARKRPLSIVPDIVVEVVSATDKPADLQARIARYQHDGVPLLWVITPETREIAVYAHTSDQPIHLSGDTMLSGGSILAGFKLSLQAVFA